MFFRIIHVLFLFVTSTAVSIAQTGNTYQRVSNLLHFTMDGAAELTDSFSFEYHGDKGSIFSELKYNAQSWGFDSRMAPVYHYGSHQFAPGGILDVRYDTMRHYQADQAGQLNWYRQAQVGWNGSAITNFDQIGYGQDYFRYRTAQEAGSNGLPVRIYSLYQNASSTSWDTASVRYLGYDGQGRLAKDSIFNVNPAGPSQLPNVWYLKNDYSYRPDGRLNRVNLWVWQNNGWVESNGYSYFYDFTGRLTQVLSGWLRGASTVVDSQSRTLYQYGSGVCTLMAYETNYGGGHWVRTTQQEYFYNSNQRMDSLTGKYVYGIGNYGDEHIRFYRNAAGLPVGSTRLRVSNGTPQPERDSVVYRYESYQSTGVPVVSKQGTVHLYPNPVKGGKLYLRWDVMPLSTDLEVRVMDMSGRELQRVRGVVTYPVQGVEIGELPAGSYVVRVMVGGEAIGVEKVGVE